MYDFHVKLVHAFNLSSVFKKLKSLPFKLSKSPNENLNVYDVDLHFSNRVTQQLSLISGDSL